MGTPIRRVELFFQEGSSDKVYLATLVDEGDDKFSVLVEWGRRGATLNQGSKAVKVPRAKAEQQLSKLIAEKTKKGYQEITEAITPAAVAPPVGQGSASRVASTGRKRTGQAAQLLNSVDEGALERLFDDDGYLAQQKLDGARVLVHVHEELIVTNRSGQHSSMPRALLEVLAEAPRGSVLDGELVSTKGEAIYWVFDLLQHGAHDLRGAPYLDRYQELDALIDQLRDPIRLVPTAVDAQDKRALYQKLAAARAEGIVFKRSDAPYTPGRPASGGAQLKYKFVKTCDTSCSPPTRATPTRWRCGTAARCARSARSSPAPPTPRASRSTSCSREGSSPSRSPSTSTRPTTTTCSSRCSWACATTRRSKSVRSRSW